MADLSGRRALVTGASRGAGVGIAKALAAAGAAVVLSARNEAALLKVKQEIEQAGGRAEVVPGDLSSRQGAREVARRTGVVDILINNAALTSAKFQSVLARDDEYWDLSINLNLLAPLVLMQELGPAMVKRGKGVIINISSISAQRGTQFHSPYSASKAAMDAMSKVAAMDLAAQGVRVLVVALGLTETEALAEACAEGITTADLARMFAPLGRTTTVQEVGSLCTYLCSDSAAALTGIVINIDGGLTAGQYAFTGSMGVGVKATKK